MATWKITTDPKGLRLDYANLRTGQRHCCGVSNSDDQSLTLDWILSTGDVNPGDLLVLTDGTVLHFAPVGMA